MIFSHAKTKLTRSYSRKSSAGLALKNPTQKNPPNKTQKIPLKKPRPVFFGGFISFYYEYVLSTNYVYLNTVCKVLHRQNIP